MANRIAFRLCIPVWEANLESHVRIGTAAYSLVSDNSESVEGSFLYILKFGDLIGSASG